ncbi:MAG: type II toxin-antitoxin system RelE/ParE family toxin [Variibacter sp.]
MDIEIADESLERLGSDPQDAGGFPPGVAKAYRRRLWFIAQATKVSDLYALHGARFEKLKGDRAGQYSMRLNDRWRLILELVGPESEETVRVITIEDYH